MVELKPWLSSDKTPRCHRKSEASSGYSSVLRSYQCKAFVFVALLVTTALDLTSSKAIPREALTNLLSPGVSVDKNRNLLTRVARKATPSSVNARSRQISGKRCGLATRDLVARLTARIIDCGID